MNRTWVTRGSVSCATLLLSALLLASCGGAGGGEGDEPSISPTRTPTATPTSPEVTRPEATIPEATTPEPSSPEPSSPEASSPEPSSPEASSPELPSPTRSVERTESEVQSATTRSPEPTEEPEAPETSSPIPTETSSPIETAQPEAGAAEESDDQDGVAPWVWWLAGALVVAGAITVPLVRRARTRSAWADGLADAESEVGWLARDLLPALRSARSRDEVAGGWAVSQGRVIAAEDRLVVLESSAHDETGQRRARVLRDAVRRTQARVEATVGLGTPGDWASDIDALIADLEMVLGSTTETPAR